MRLSILLWHFDRFPGLQASLGSLHRAWMDLPAKLRTDFQLRLKIVDEGTPPPRDLEIARILEKEKLVFPWEMDAVRMPLVTGRTRFLCGEIARAPADEWFLTLEAGDEITMAFFLEALSLPTQQGLCAWRIPGSAPSPADGFSWSGTLFPVAALKGFAPPVYRSWRLSESGALDLGFELRERGVEMRSLVSCAMDRLPKAPPPMELALQIFEESIGVRRGRGERGVWAWLGLLPQTLRLLVAHRRQARRILRAWGRLRPGRGRET